MSDVVTTNQLMVVLEEISSDIKAVLDLKNRLSSQIADTKIELKEDIASVDAKLTALDMCLERWAEKALHAN